MHALALPDRPRADIAPDGTVEGYASLFGVVDSARDMVMPGAFAQSLKARGLRRIPMLFQHDPAEPIGIWLELREDWRGLYARGRLIPDVVRGREVLALVRAGAVDGLSIGFRTTQARVDARTRVRRLHHVDLWEISIVTFPLLDGARVEAVKHSVTPEQDERLLRRFPRLSFARKRAEQEWNGVSRTSEGKAAMIRESKETVRGIRPAQRIRRKAMTPGPRIGRALARSLSGER